MSSGSLLTYLTQAQIRDSVRTLVGKMVTQPALLKTDGADVTYAANVEISTDPADLALDLGVSLIASPSDEQVIAWARALGVSVPDSPTSDQMAQVLREVQAKVLAGDLTNRVLYNVPCAQGNRDLVYASAGMAVTLNRTAAGTFEIAGFATKAPGKRTRVAVHLGTIAPGDGSPGTPPTIGEGTDVTLRIYYLTLLDLSSAEFGNGWGSVPFGSCALYRGDTLVALNGTPKG